MSKTSKNNIVVWSGEYVDIQKLRPNPNNPRSIDDTGKKRLREDIAAGIFKPLVVNADYTILGGNQRYNIYLEEGINPVWVSLPSRQLSEEEAKLIILKDNHGRGVDDLEKLARDFAEEIDALDLDIKLVEELEEVSEDEEFEEPEENIHGVIRGDIWLLGGHRLVCGDATNLGDVEKLMDGKLADMVFTDPPYNTGMTAKTQAGKGNTLWKGKKKTKKARLSHMFNDSFTEEEWQDFMQLFISSYNIAMKEDAAAYICLDWRRSYELIPHIKDYFKLSNIIVWDKVVHELGSDYKYTYELVHVCKKGKPQLDTHQGDREYSDVWHIQRKMTGDTSHATKKPIELCARAIRHASKKGGIVLDLFGGSGSTLIACEQTDRKCYIMELDEHYCSVIIARWEEFTGQKAIRYEQKTEEVT